MDNDKLFAAYTLTLVVGVALMLTFALSANFSMAPTPFTFVEHLLLGFAMRGSYKLAQGFEISDWIPAFHTVPAASVATLEPAPADDFSEERLAA